MGALSWWHVLLVVVVALLLFGGKRLPEAARGLGRSMRILKSEVGAMSEDSKKDAQPEAAEYRADSTVAPPAPITPTPLPAAAAQPLPPVQPIEQSPQITINGRRADLTK